MCPPVLCGCRQRTAASTSAYDGILSFTVAGTRVLLEVGQGGGGVLSLMEVLEVPPYLLHIYPGGIGCLRGRMPLPPFKYGVHSIGSKPTMEGSIHATISVAASSNLLQESAISDRQTALVIPLTMLQLW